MHRKPLYVLASGGTGGHVFPAISLAEQLYGSQRHVYLFTDCRGKNFPKADCLDGVVTFKLYKSHGVFGRFLLYLSILWQTIRCCFIYRKLKPTSVVGFGGYPSVPPVWAAQIMGIPTVLHEQNAVLGKANRFLAKRAYRVATSFPKTRFLNDGCYQTGNPVRPQILDLHKKVYGPPVDGPFVLLIFGGSQGAAIFSEVVPKALTFLPLDLQRRLKVYQQCRPEYVSQTKALYRESFIDVTLEPFFDNMAELYEQAHLVISRSGASTVAELAVAGKPAILVPYAASREGDQHANAQWYSSAGAAWMIEEKNFTLENLQKHITLLMGDAKMLVAASEAMHQLALPNASENLAHVVTQVVGDVLTEKGTRAHFN
jgi:UDP-N-acetylglucosamine--N-acetylmuramyl-(pentapeptide) pyrophosphoryl-undecaprenol N-acetylglucosamine transferase